MKIDGDLVVQLRIDKSWSQDELAIASGLNLRTVQRIEKEASASLQSKKALASAFDINIHDLDYEELPMLQELKGKDVSIALDSTEAFRESPKGKVIEVNDSWIKLETKKNVQYIRIEAIFRIVLMR